MAFNKMDEENNNPLSEEELEGIIQQNPQIGITDEKKKQLTEQVTAPILKEAEERMTQAIRSRKPVEGLSREEQIAETPEGQIPPRPSGVPSPKSDKVDLPTTLPKHGIRALFSEGERILERASQVTNLPPESPATQAIAQRMAKGDPFSSEALEDARDETMRLVRAGMIPNPYYEGFSGSVLQAYETIAPMVIETGAPMIVGAAFSPMLFSPVPGSRLGYFKLLGATSFTSNLIAQQMRIGYGHQDKTSWSEATAATFWGMAPGLKTPKDMTKIGKVLVRGLEGAFMASGENATRQGLELLYGKDGKFNVGEFGLTAATGFGLGAAVGRLESALVKYDPKEPSAALLRKAVKDELKAVKKEVGRLKKAGQRRGLKVHEEKIAKLEKNLEDLKLPENKILQRAIDQLEEYEQKQVEAFELYAKEFEESKAAQALKESDIPTAKPTEVVEAPKAEEPVVAEKPEAEVKQQAREALDDFMAGGGTREVDPETGKLMDTEDEIKARLLTDDGEKQRLINAVQEAIKEDLQNVKGGREGKLEYLSKVQKELDRRLGVEAGDEYALVLKASQLSDNLEVADALNELSVQMTANGAVMVKGFDDLLKYTREKDFNNVEDLNDAMVSIHKLIPQMLGWKKTGSAAGRLLQSRKYTKDSLEVKVEELEKQLEENLVSNLKNSKDLTPEQLDKQIKTFGDIEAVKKLLKAVQQADDVSEIKKILMDQQNAFQNKNTLKNYLKSTLKGEALTEAKLREGETSSAYIKVRDVGMDVAYSSMLSSPTTAMKVGIGNAVMSRYHTWMGRVGAKYMALAPWARRGMSKQEFQSAYDFWSKTASSYKEFNDIALQEARRVFKSGDSDLESHFERVGESALSMERTGLSGALGQSVENLGQFIDVPGKALTALDSRTRMRVAHAMTKAKAEHDWHLAKLNGEEVPDNFDEYYQSFLAKVFNDKRNKLMTEDQVRRQAILNAEKEGVDENNLASYIDNYVKNNWDTSTSNFVNYVQRNLKEITFTDELGEFTKMNAIEKGLAVPAENFLNSFPLLKTILSPFQRTGRNIIREAASTSAILADLPVVSKYADNLWAKTVQDLNSGDPIVAARAKGRQIVGAGIIATAWGMAEAGLYVGTIAQNWKKRENIEAGTGLSDYQLRIPGPDGVMVGVDISPLEPFATVMNIVADCHTLSRGTMAQKKEAMDILNILGLVVSNNIGNKSYFKNLGDAIELVTLTSESEQAADAQKLRLVKGLISTTVPSVLNSQSMATDDVRRRSDTILQLIGKRLAGIAREVPAYRDAFGDPMPLHTGDAGKVISMFNPFKFSVSKMKVDDYITEDKELGTRRFNKEKFKNITLNKKSKNYSEEEVRNAAHAVIIELDGEYNFNNGTTIKDGVDLQEIVHDETRIDAFSRWQEIYQKIKDPSTGLTIKEAIVAEAKTPEFLNAFSVDPNRKSKEYKETDERLQRINTVFEKYRSKAYEQLEVEYPVLREHKEETKYRNRLKRYGLPDSPEERKIYKEKVLGRIYSEMPAEEYKKTQPDTRLKELLKKTPYMPVTLD
jgi:uncharacterized protein YukE